MAPSYFWVDPPFLHIRILYSVVAGWNEGFAAYVSPLFRHATSVWVDPGLRFRLLLCQIKTPRKRDEKSPTKS